MLSKVPPVLAALAVIALFVGCSSCSKGTESTAPGARKAAGNFVVVDAQGNKVSLADYKREVVLLNFWTTWCGPCKVEIPWFIEFQKQYQDRGFTVLGVSMDDDGWKSVKPYLGEHKINYPVVIGNDDVSRLYGGIDSIPRTFMVDRDGKIASIHTGLVSKDVYEIEIRSLLGTEQRADATRPRPE